MLINQREYIGLAVFNSPEYVLTRQDIVTAHPKYRLLFAGWKGADYLPTATAMQVIDAIKINRGFNTTAIHGNIPEMTFLFGKYEAVRIMPAVFEGLYSGDGLSGLYLKSDEAGNIVTLRIDIPTACPIRDAGWNMSDDVWAAVKRTLQAIVFLRFTDPELTFVAAGKKQGTRKQGYYNATSSNITIVDSTWNKFIIRTEGFGVTGHFRLQPHGEKSQLRKLIWVQPFQKHGYVRRPKAETANA